LPLFEQQPDFSRCITRLILFSSGNCWEKRQLRQWEEAVCFAAGKVVEAVPHMLALGQVQADYSRKLLSSVMDFSNYISEYSCREA